MMKIHASIFTVALAIFGAAASVAQLFPAQQGIVQLLLAGSVLSVPVGYGAVLVRRRTMRGEEQPDLISPQVAEEMTSRCGRIEFCAAQPEDVEIIALQERQAYLVEDAVPQSVLESWFARNPTGFSCIKVRGEMAGHFNLIAPKAEALRMLIDGTMLEREVEAESLWSARDRARIRTLYVESIAMPGASGVLKGVALHCLLQNFEALIERCADPLKLKRLYAMAATERGQDLLRHLGFRVCRPAGARRDNHDLFLCEYPKLKSNIAALVAEHEAARALSRRASAPQMER